MNVPHLAVQVSDVFRALYSSQLREIQAANSALEHAADAAIYSYCPQPDLSLCMNGFPTFVMEVEPTKEAIDEYVRRVGCERP